MLQLSDSWVEQPSLLPCSSSNMCWVSSILQRKLTISVMESVWGSVHHGVLNLNLTQRAQCYNQSKFYTYLTVNCFEYSVELADNSDWCSFPHLSSVCQVHCEHLLFSQILAQPYLLKKISSKLTFSCFIYTGEKEQEAFLGASYCSYNVSYSCYLFCVHYSR
jgi:hypothetical protein